MTISVATFDPDAAAPAALDWQLPIHHLSASSLKMAMRCPRQWQERYIAGKRERPGAAAALGSAEWGAHVINYEQKMTTGVDLPDISDAYATAWDEAIERSGGVGEISWSDSQKPEAMQTLGLKMAEAYHAEVSPRTDPVAVEQKIEFPVGSVPVPMLGFIDLVKATSTVEHKTGKSALKVPKNEWLFQQRIYSSYTGYPGEIHLVTKTAAPRIVTPLESPEFFIPYNKVQAEMTEQLVEKTAWFLNYLFVTYGPDDPWPQHGITHDWACGWCAYKAGCPAWRTT